MGIWDSVKINDTKKVIGSTGIFSDVEVKPQIPKDQYSYLFDTPESFNVSNSTPQTTDTGTADYLKSTAKDAISFFNPKNTGDQNPVNFIDTAKEIPGSISRIVGQPQLRAYGAVGNKLSEKLGLSGNELTPEGQFQKDIYGTDQPISLSSVGRETRGADPSQKSTGIFSKIDPAIGFVVGSLDAFDGGVLGKLKGVLGLSKEARILIAESKDVGEIASTLKREIPELTDNLANAFAKPLTVIDDPNTVESIINKTKFQIANQLKEVKPPVYEGSQGLTLTTLDKLKGRATVSKQYISDLTNSADIKQTERLLLREALTKYPDGKDVPVKEFANTVEKELLPLERTRETGFDGGNSGRYELVNLPTELRGNVANYSEHIYQSPIETSAGDIHFSKEEYPSYFGHTRVEDIAVPSGNKILDDYAKGKITKAERDDLIKNVPSVRRVIEVQSDLYQKGNLELESSNKELQLLNKRLSDTKSDLRTAEKIVPEDVPKLKKAVEYLQAKVDELASKEHTRLQGVAKLQQYNDPTAHFRMIREEIKQAAQDGITKLQFPTGETAMKIEGLGQNNIFLDENMDKINPSDLKVGKVIQQNSHFGNGPRWIVTDVLGDGKFKAVPKKDIENVRSYMPGYNENFRHKITDEKVIEYIKQNEQNIQESFDISGKVDTNNPIYKFYEKDVAKYLNKFGGKRVTDSKGVEWVEVPIHPEMAKIPVQAFGVVAGFEQDENGNIKFNPEKAVLGTLALSLRGEININTLKKIAELTTPGPIADELEKTFTNVSRRTLEIFSKSLAKLKTTDAISGIIKNLDRINEEIKATTADGLPGIAGSIPKETVPFEDSQYIPKALAELATQSERTAYLDSIIKNIKTKEDYALASAEYQSLFSKLNARSVVRYEELKIEKDMIRTILDESPAKELLKYKDRKEGGYNLEEVKGKDLDSKVEELGFKDLADAQSKLDEYLVLRDRWQSLKGEIKSLLPEVRIAKLLKGYLDDVPVVQDRGVLTVVDSIANTADVRGTFKDISGFEKEALDPARIFKKFFSTRYSEIEESILVPFRKSKADMVDKIDTLAKQIEDNVTKRFNIQRGSKEDTLIREYGEGKKGWQDIVDAVGEDRAKDIVAADSFFRGWYDKNLDRANEILAKIYPNNPEKLIPKHSNYYRHLREGSALNDTLQAVKNLFESPSGIDPKLAGVSEFSKPKSKWLAFAQRRLGEKTDTTALEGAIDYVSSLAYLEHISPHISSFRYLRRRLAEVAPTPGDPQEIGLGKESGINNMLVFLDNFSNRLAGKSHPLDRWVSDTIPGGRQTMNILNFVNNRVKANSILGSLSSAVAQLGHIPEAVASTKQYSLHGARRTLGSIFVENEPMKSSEFLKERKMQALVSRFKVDWLAHPIQGTVDRSKDVALWLLQATDDIGTNFVWNSHYEKALSENMDNPIRYADNKTRDIVGGRGIGEVPLGQESKIFKFAFPFMLEVGNAMWVYKDFFSEKDFAGLALLLLGSYMFNEGAEKVRGNRVLYDPLNALIEGTQMLSEEKDKKVGATKFIGRQVGEFLSNVPLGQSFAGTISDQTVESVTQFIDSFGGLVGDGVPLNKQQLFGQGDPGRYGSGFLMWNALKDPIFNFLLPFGGSQFKKTKEGIDAYLDGKVVDKNGKTNFTINQNGINLVKAILFGKNSTEESTKFFDQRDDLFRRLDRQKESRNQMTIDAENKWDELKDIGKEKGSSEVKAQLKLIAESNPDLAKKILEIVKDEKAGLNSNDRLIKMLGVDNGERAKYVYEQMKDLSVEDKKNLLKEYAQNKIITKKVLDQIVEMKKTD